MLIYVVYLLFLMVGSSCRETPVLRGVISMFSRESEAVPSFSHVSVLNVFDGHIRRCGDVPL